jgi:Gram-negative bacterial TonB protein C-terminal
MTSTPLVSESRAQTAAPPVTLSPVMVWLLITLTLALMSVPRLHGQDLLADARSLYQSAAYDEALSTLQRLSSARATLSATDIRELEEYRFLCLSALGRTQEARLSMAAVVASDPLYRLEASATSPRILTAFQEVRRELLPALTSTIYAEAKTAYDRRDYAAAQDGFESVLALQADPDMQGRHADLATLARGFLDLSVAALKAVAAPTPSPVVTMPAPIVDAPSLARPADIKLPVTVRQNVPPVPPSVMRMGVLRPGMLEILIDETGKVEGARFITPIHPVYDQMVLNAARAWRYQPATADGTPIKFKKTLRVAVQAPQ